MNFPATALFVITFLAATVHVRAQTRTLESLAQQSADYRKSLPSFTCEEAVVSVGKYKGKVQRRVEFRANIRVVRASTGTLAEDLNFTTFNGKPATKPHYAIPFGVQGGLSRAFPAFFSAEKQPCYHYELTSSRIDFAWRSSIPPCDEVPSTQGFVLLDPAGNIQHAETTRDPDEAWSNGFTSRTTVDYAPVSLNDALYQLPSHLYAEMQDGDWLGTFDAHYTNCRLFHATITLGPATIQPGNSPR